MKEIPRMTGMIRMTRMYDWHDYRTELNTMTGKTVVAGTNGMTEMTGITTMNTETGMRRMNGLNEMSRVTDTTVVTSLTRTTS